MRLELAGACWNVPELAQGWGHDLFLWDRGFGVLVFLGLWEGIGAGEQDFAFGFGLGMVYALIPKP